MNIMYCGDKNIEKGLIISVLSLTKHTTEPLDIFVLTLGLRTDGCSCEPVGDDVITYLDGYVKERNQESSVRLFDMTECFMEELPAANLSTRFTPCCMLRLYADKLPDMPDRILYLDNDVVCRSSFEDYYNQDMEGYEFAGTLDYYGRWFFRRNLFRLDYFNSGVLLLNMKQIRKTGLFQKCRERCRTKEIFFPDQTTLNKLCNKKKVQPRRFNDQHGLHEDTVFQHFSTGFLFFPYVRTQTVKPWDIERMHSVLGLYEYDDLLNEYLAVINKLGKDG